MEKKQYDHYPLRLLTGPETCKLLGVSPGTLQNLREKGQIKALKFGSRYRYRPESIEKFLEEYDGSEANAYYGPPTRRL